MLGQRGLPVLRFLAKKILAGVWAMYGVSTVLILLIVRHSRHYLLLQNEIEMEKARPKYMFYGKGVRIFKYFI